MDGAISFSCVAPFTAIVGLSWYCRGFEISLQRYNIFGQVVGNVLPIITGGCNFSPDGSGRTRAGAVGFEISLQRYYIFLPFVGQVRPIITEGCIF